MVSGVSGTVCQPFQTVKFDNSFLLSTIGTDSGLGEPLFPRTCQQSWAVKPVWKYHSMPFKRI